MVISEIIHDIELFAPLNLQEEYDNAGLACGKPSEEIKGILLTIDITEQVIDEAIANNCNLIISHHPIIFGGIKTLATDTLVNRCLIKAIKHNIALYSSHTNLDSAKYGVSHKMADKIGLGNRRILAPTDNEHGFGIIGELSTPTNSLEFIKSLKTTFNCSCIKHSPLCCEQVSKIALCGGSGASFISNAILSEADIYITGDIKYHDWFKSDNRIILVDIGHYESEQFTKEIFYEIVRKKMSKFAVRFSETVTNPVSII